MDWIRNAVKSLIRKKGRTFLTILSITVGVTSVILISSIGSAGTQAVQQEIAGMGVGTLCVSADLLNESGSFLKNNHLHAIRTLSCVKQAVPVLSLRGKGMMRGREEDVLVWGIDAGNHQIFSLVQQYGRPLRQKDVQQYKRVCLIDQKTAQKLYSRTNITGKELTVTLNGISVSLKIIGVVDSGGSIMQNVVGEVVPGFLYLPYTTMQEILGVEYLDQIAVTLNENVDEQQSSQRILNLMEESEGESGTFQVQNIAKQKDQLERILQIITQVLSVIAGISLVVAGLGVMTVMLASVSERTREIGIKKSIGASKTDIMREFLLEAVLISAAGSLFGVMCGFFLSAAASVLMKESILISPKTCLCTVLITNLLGIIFGVYPSLQAAKMDPVQALRAEN